MMPGEIASNFSASSSKKAACICFPVLLITWDAGLEAVATELADYDVKAGSIRLAGSSRLDMAVGQILTTTLRASQEAMHECTAPHLLGSRQEGRRCRFFYLSQ